MHWVPARHILDHSLIQQVKRPTGKGTVTVYGSVCSILCVFLAFLSLKWFAVSAAMATHWAGELIRSIRTCSSFSFFFISSSVCVHSSVQRSVRSLFSCPVVFCYCPVSEYCLDLIAWITHLLCAILGFPRVHRSVGLLTCPIQAVTTMPKPASFICFQNLTIWVSALFPKK